MELVKIKNKEALSLPHLWRVALKSIYDKKHLNFKEEKQMHESVILWTNHIELRRDMNGGEKFFDGSVDAENELKLQLIGMELYRDSKGEFDKRKELFRKHKIDYMKFYRLPEAYTNKDFAKGQEALNEHKRTNPEDYE